MGEAAVTGHEPHFGRTRHGFPVHLHVLDYHAADTWYQKRTQKLALWITGHVGSMNCFFLFNVLALLSLPATLKLAGIHINSLYTTLPAFFLTFGWIYLITWICQNYIQLVALPAIIVGQNLQNAAADARAAKTFEDVESVRIDLTTTPNPVAMRMGHVPCANSRMFVSHIRAITVNEPLPLYNTVGGLAILQIDDVLCGLKEVEE